MTAEHIKSKPSAKVTLTNAVHLHFDGSDFALRQGGEVRVDGVMVSLPLNHPSGVTIRQAGTSLVVSYY